ncbi:MAG: DUF1223 domain-containing protein [Rhodocyclaceae bacterium]|nr:DUF1223 domain-containing protein [Rhodocyclaceae bacterium]
MNFSRLSGRAVLVLAATCTGTAWAGAECSVASGRERMLLVELYTSEGCNSCPPADRWLSGLHAEARSGQLLPLAFHVDYWDYLGWRDPYAQARFSVRQRASAARAGTRNIYTPQVIADGRSFDVWRRPGSVRDAMRRAVERAPGASLQLSVKANAGGAELVYSVEFAPGILSGEIFLARWESGLTSSVSGGENRGVLLRHDYVVRDWIGPLAGRSGKHTLRGVPGANEGWALLVYSPGGAELLQAVNLAGAACAMTGGAA